MWFKICTAIDKEKRNDIDPKTVAEILGHASAEFTLDVYTHVTAGMKKEAAQKISGFMASVG